MKKPKDWIEYVCEKCKLSCGYSKSAEKRYHPENGICPCCRGTCGGHDIEN